MSPSIEQLLHDANPAHQADVNQLALGDAPQLLRDAITEVERAPAHGRRRPRSAWLVRFGTAAVLAVVAVFLVSSLDRRGSHDQAWAASAVKLAESVPRVLPADTGWRVTYADQLSADDGSVRFAKGNRSVELTWYARSQYDRYFEDRQHGTRRFADAHAAGQRAAMFQYDGADDYFAMWKVGDHFIEARTQQDIPPKWQNQPMLAGGAGAPTFVTHFDEASFRAVIENLDELSVDAWLRRMPASVVKPADSADAVHDMLAGIPTPKRFDPATLIDDTAPRDPYQLGAKVTGAVACGWIRQWVTAIQTHDAAAAEEAVAAMATSHRWPVLQTMAKSGAYPDELWSLADAMKRGRPGDLGMYQDGLGCPTG